MPIVETFLLAIESLFANKLRAGLTMLGMIIGVGAVVLLVSIGNGAKNYISYQFQSLGTNFIVIQPGKKDSKSGFGPPIGQAKRKLTLGDVEALERYAINLDAVSSLMFGMATAKISGKTMDVTLLGTNERFLHIFNIVIQSGSYFSKEESDTSRRVAVIGHTVAKNLFGTDSPLGHTVRINDNEHRIIAVITESGNKLGLDIDEMIIVPTKSAMRILNEENLFGIRAKAKSRVGMEDAVEEIKAILKERHNGEEDFTVLTQASMVETMNTILGMLTYVLGGIAMISMFVGGIGIMNIMLVSVTERTREIGIRRAVGAKRSDILKQFLVEAILLSMAGGIIGLLSSVFLTYLIWWFLPQFDMRAPVWILIPAFLLSLLTGVFFGVWPARKASQIETIEALRFE